MPLIKKLDIDSESITHQCWLLESDILCRDFKLFISLLVDNEIANSEVSVIYLLDANSLFSIVEGMIRLLQSTNELPPLILVGIGYEDSSIENIANRRIQELTPTKDIHYKHLWSEFGAIVADGGQAQKLMQVIKEEIQPFIKNQYSPSDHSILVGDSLGGLFALYTLFTESSLFGGYIVGSPAIFWDQGYIWQQEDRCYSKDEQLNADLFLGVGELEDSHPYHFPKSVRHLVSDIKLVNDVKAMSKKLDERDYRHLNMVTHVFESETHMSVIAPLISRGLRCLLNRDNG